MNLLSLDTREFLWELATQLQRNPSPTDTPFQLWRHSDRPAGGESVPAIAHDSVAGRCRRNAPRGRSRTSSGCCGRIHDLRPALTVVLAADPRRVKRLGRRLLELCELRIDLESWEPDDTRQYLQHCLTAAGSGPARVRQCGHACGCTIWLTGFPGTSATWPNWRSWPAPASTCRRSTRRPSTRCTRNCSCNLIVPQRWPVSRRRHRWASPRIAALIPRKNTAGIANTGYSRSGDGREDR